MGATYFFPPEDGLHEGTWLSWPHKHTYGVKYQNELEPIWVEMVRALHPGETVHLLIYDLLEQARVAALLDASGVDMGQVDFTLAKSNDVWVRDTGPLFVYDAHHTPTIVDFAFDGWGKKAPYQKDNAIPATVAEAKNIPILSVPDMVLEGGAVELDGFGTLMACKSSVIGKNRNRRLPQEQAEGYLKAYFGVSNFIWLTGVTGQDITDWHIDGIARFYNSETLLTVSEADFFELYEDMPASDYEALLFARNAQGAPYKKLELPMTAKNVEGLDYKGSYLNYYVANKVVLAPVYHDANDAAAVQILSELYAGRTVVPIDVTALYQYGGMLHCVTQQQPAQ